MEVLEKMLVVFFLMLLILFTWKNFAVAWLTPPGALKEYDAVKYGLIALKEYIKDEESKKKDDLADTVMQAISFTKRTEPLKKTVKKKK